MKINETGDTSPKKVLGKKGIFSGSTTLTVLHLLS